MEEESRDKQKDESSFYRFAIDKTNISILVLKFSKTSWGKFKQRHKFEEKSY